MGDERTSTPPSEMDSIVVSKEKSSPGTAAFLSSILAQDSSIDPLDENLRREMD